MAATGSKKILEERLTAFEGMKSIMDKVARGERLTVEERSDFDARNLRISELDADLRTAREAESLAEKMRTDAQMPEAPEINLGETRARAFSEYLRTGSIAPVMRNSTVSMGAGPLGPSTASQTPGYLVPPGWWQRLQVALKAYGGIANDFQQLETETGQSIQWATVDPTSVVGTFITEVPQGNSSVPLSGYAFGQGTLSAYMMTSGVQLVSIQLAQDSAFDIDGFVQDRVGEAIGRGMAANVVTGSGSGAPLGITTALGAYNSGSQLVQVTSAQTVNIGGGAVTPLAANTLPPSALRGLIAAVDPAYRAQGAKFYMSDAQLLGLRGLQDANGRPLVNLQDGVTPGVPTSIWGYEVVVDNNIGAITSSATNSGVNGPIFGHLQSAMVLRKVKDVAVLRLDQRYAEYLQIGFIGYLRWDSRSNDLRAAATVEYMATS